MGRRPVSVDRLIDYIEARILSREYPPGSALPSVRRLAGKFKLSYSTTYRALEKLGEAGILTRRDGVGFLIADRPFARNRNGRKIIAMIEGAPQSSVHQSGMAHSALLAARNVLEAENYSIEIRQENCSTMTLEKIRDASFECDGMMLLGTYDYALSNLETFCPTVGMIMQDSFNGRLSTVNLDPFDAARQAVNYFLGRSSRVVIVSSPKPVYRYRARVFSQIWTDIGGRIEFVEPSTFHFEDQANTGYFFSSDDWLNNASSTHFEHHGCRLEDKFVVLGIDGKHLLNPDYPVFPTIGIEWRKAGEIVAEELLRLIDHPGSLTRNIAVCGKLLNV
jgi:DNA-binding transcriptional regulator YhcF (GntR family)